MLLIHNHELNVQRTVRQIQESTDWQKQIICLAEYNIKYLWISAEYIYVGVRVHTVSKQHLIN